MVATSSLITVVILVLIIIPVFVVVILIVVSIKNSLIIIFGFYYYYFYGYYRYYKHDCYHHCCPAWGLWEMEHGSGPSRPPLAPEALKVDEFRVFLGFRAVYFHKVVSEFRVYREGIPTLILNPNPEL